MYTSTELINLNSYKLLIAIEFSQLIQVFIHFLTGIFTIARLPIFLILNKVNKKKIKFYFIFIFLRYLAQ